MYLFAKNFVAMKEESADQTADGKCVPTARNESRRLRPIPEHGALRSIVRVVIVKVFYGVN